MQQGDQVDEYDEDYSPDDDTAPYWHPGEHLPAHARQVGLTHHVPDGALLDFAGSLDGTKRLHRLTAWVLLAVFGFPVLMYVVRIIMGLTY